MLKFWHVVYTYPSYFLFYMDYLSIPLDLKVIANFHMYETSPMLKVVLDLVLLRLPTLNLRKNKKDNA